MKTLKKLSLNFLSKSELRKRQMFYLTGGDSCACMCLNEMMVETAQTVHIGQDLCDGTCGCVCGGEDAQSNCDNHWYINLSSY